MSIRMLRFSHTLMKIYKKIKISFWYSIKKNVFSLETSRLHVLFNSLESNSWLQLMSWLRDSVDLIIGDLWPKTLQGWYRGEKVSYGHFSHQKLSIKRKNSVIFRNIGIFESYDDFEPFPSLEILSIWRCTEFSFFFQI